MVSGDENDGHVFCPSKGRLAESYLSHRCLHYRRKAGLPDNINFHSLRHTTASWLVQNGASLEAIRPYLGHHSVTVTERYGPLSPAVYAQQIKSALREATG